MSITLNLDSIKPSITSVCLAHENSPDQLLEVLHAVQSSFGYIPTEAFQIIADCLNISRADVYGVVTFYHDFKQRPPAKKTIKLCLSEACQSMGARALRAELESEFAIETDKPQAGAEVAIETIYCLGNCALGPSAMVDNKVYGRVDSTTIKSALEQS